MNKTIGIVIAVIIIIAAGGGIWYNQSKKTQTQMQAHTDNDGHAMDQHMGSATSEHMEGDGHGTEEHMGQMMGEHGDSESGHGALIAGSRVDMKNISTFKTGKVDFAFKLFSKDAKELTPQDMNVVHESRLHFILVRDDLSTFQHLHPEYKSGLWSVTTTVDQAGGYNIYYDISPVKETAQTLYQGITIGGSTQNPQFPAVSNGKASISGYTVTLSNFSELKTGAETELEFTLAQNGNPVGKVDPYLGAYGHVVGLKEGEAESYLHIHPVTETAPQNGVVKFGTEFSDAGRYTLFAQFKINGQVTTFPITLDVNKGNEQSTDGSKPHGH